MSNFIGPALPPHLQKKLEICDGESQSQERDNVPAKESNSEKSTIGPSLPSEYLRTNSKEICVEGFEIGPSLPNDVHELSDNSDARVSPIGPALPFHLKQKCGREKNTVNVGPGSEDEDNSILILHAETSDDETFKDTPKEEMYGPALPPGLKIDSSKIVKEVKKNVIGPSLPQGMKIDEEVQDENSDSDTDIVGPIPMSDGLNSSNYIQEQLNERALRMKRKLTREEGDNTNQVKRESWMLELPPDRAAEFGLGPRQFRVREKLDVGDRSVWTDTPSDRLKKKDSEIKTSDVSSELELRSIHERDKEMERLVEHHSSKKKKDSLLEMHQKELKKKRKKEKEEGKAQERRPFDRNIDLQANRFDEAQKKAIFKKAQLLNDRFSSGQSKFL